MKDAPRYHISEIVDIEALQELFQHLSDVTGISTAVLDLDGNILIATNWQDVCINFHRINPETAARCAKSDTVLAGKLEAGQSYNIYLCKNGLVDVAVPIIVNDAHIGNLFTGQFFFQPPDFQYFEKQAAEHEFDREAYFEALSKVPVFTREYVEQIVSLLCRLAQVIGQMGLNKLDLKEKNMALLAANAKLQEYHDHLKDLVAERTAELDRANQLLREDIRRREKAEEKLRTANRELEAFVYTVSHDLRTPLSPIIMYADMLREMYKEKLDNQALDFLAEIKDQGLKMMELMEGLLDLAKAGHACRISEPVSADEVASEVVRSLQHLMVQKDVTVNLSSLPAIHVPKAMLFQIFANLIGNALCYAGEGDAPILVGGERRGDKVRLFVRDHGPGIPEDERMRVFDLFFRGGSGEKKSGTGIGLATVQKIAHAYGGAAWVEETPGGGSTFVVEFVYTI